MASESAAGGGGEAAAPSDPFSPQSGTTHENHPFFHYYGLLVHQQNMLQDPIRTGTYHKAITINTRDFKDKVVLDVGTGSGILAYFAVKAGARKVYAVEASDVAKHARRLMEANGLGDKVVVLQEKIEEVDIPEPVDTIISEPMGFLLVHERMLESYIIARQRFLKPGGKMMPSNGTIFVAPFTDQALWNEQCQRAAFWQTPDFWGLDLSCLHDKAVADHFSQPIVGYFSPSILIANTTTEYKIDFEKDTPEDLRKISIPFSFLITRTAIMHGLACWFDVLFDGSEYQVTLSTGPYTPGTHWYQCRLLFKEPIAVNASQRISGVMEMEAHEKYSYFIRMDAELEGAEIRSTAHINLQDQYYHYMQVPQDASTWDAAAADAAAFDPPAVAAPIDVSKAE